MVTTFTDENGQYCIDYSHALWATDDINQQYHLAHCFLSDVDWIIEIEEKILLVEYKNANIEGAANPDAFRPSDDNVLNKIARKFFDSLHYLTLLGKSKPIEYIFILEYPNSDSVSRRMIRNKLKVKLPFTLQDNIGKKKLIEKVEVYSIEEWNENEEYGKYPITKCAQK